MATCREQIEHLEYWVSKKFGNPWKTYSYSRKWLKKQMNRYLRRKNKNISEDDYGYKSGRKPLYGYEY